MSDLLLTLPDDTVIECVHHWDSENESMVNGEWCDSLVITGFNGDVSSISDGDTDELMHHLNYHINESDDNDYSYYSDDGYHITYSDGVGS